MIKSKRMHSRDVRVYITPSFSVCDVTLGVGFSLGQEGVSPSDHRPNGSKNTIGGIAND